MLMAYLLNEEIAIEADLFDTHEAPPVEPTADAFTLYRYVPEFWGWDVDTLVPIHGSPTPAERIRCLHPLRQ